ncbi:MAG: beta-lactamase family protein [Oligoflexia bacterium]|nr:beta-lactamase family protein [Oligoflexia bacterium]
MKKIFSLLFLLFIFGIILLNHNHPLASDDTKAILSELNKTLLNYKEEYHFPSLSAAIAINGKIFWSNSVGVKELSLKNMATPETIYRIGSVSKPIAAIAVMKLVQDKKIDLDKTMDFYLASYFEKEKTALPQILKDITVGQVLTHTSGIRHYDYKQGEKEYRGPLLSPAKAMNLYGVLEKSEFKAGQGFLYSTFAYNLLQYLIATVSGKSYVQFLKDEIFAAADMKSSGLDHPTEGIQIEAKPYSYDSSNNTFCDTPTVDVRWKISAGGLASTVVDLAKLLIALENEKILSKKTQEMMYTDVNKTYKGKKSNYGIGHRIWNFSRESNGQDNDKDIDANETLWIGHGGTATGSASYFLHNPNKKIIVTVIGNLQVKSKPVSLLASRLAHIVDKQMPLLPIEEGSF